MTKVRVGGGSSASRAGTLRPQGTYAGTFDPSVGLPTVGTGKNGAIVKSDWWLSSGAGTIAGLSPFTLFAAGDTITALVNNADAVAEFVGNKGTGGSAGAGTVTTFSAGNLSPLFTSSVANPTTTPALTFAQVNQSANLVFAGPTTGIAAAPTFRSLVAADIPNLSAVYDVVGSAAAAQSAAISAAAADATTKANAAQAFAIQRANHTGTQDVSTLTGTLLVTQGGTGTVTQFTAGSVVYAGALGVYSENNTKFFWNNSAETLFIGSNSTTFTGVKLNSIGTVTSYMQNNIQNLSSNAAASSDVVVTSDNGTDTDKYGDFGVNSSGWSGTGVLDTANTVYLYSKNVPLSIGTDGAATLKLFTGGITSVAERLSFTSAGLVTFTTPVPGSVWTSSWTASANNQSSRSYGGSLVSRSTSGDAIAADVFNSSIALDATNTQTGSMVNVAGTFTGGSTNDTAHGLLVTTSAVGSSIGNRSHITIKSVSGDAIFSIIAQDAGGTAFFDLKAGSTADVGVNTQRYRAQRAPGTNGNVTHQNTGTGDFIWALNGSTISRFTSGGQLFVGGSTTPTALVHIAAGTATASTAPLKFTSGTNTTTAEAGAMEYNGTNLFFTRAGTVRENVLVAIDNVAAPTTSIGVAIVNYYGANATNYLGDPNRWLSVNVLGNTYKIPLYN